MVSNFHLPPVGFGPGSQSDEDEELGYMQLPSGMRTYWRICPRSRTNPPWLRR